MVDDENRKKKNSAELSMIHSIIGQYNGGINLVLGARSWLGYKCSSLSKKKGKTREKEKVENITTTILHFLLVLFSVQYLETVIDRTRLVSYSRNGALG